MSILAAASYTPRMRQVLITRSGPPEVLQLRESPDPLPRNGEVRIRVEASGINFADILGRMGMYGDAPAMPYVPGYEVAGVVDAIGQGVLDLREGDNVLALTRFGGYSDMVCVPYKQVFPRLDWMSARDGAAIPAAYLTAYVSLVVMGAVRPGDRVLIHNAGGSVGLAALTICKILGAVTYGTASPHKLDFLREQGLQHAIDYRNHDYEQVLLDLTGGKGVQLVLDSLGGRHWYKNYRLLMPTGRLVLLGASSRVGGKRRSWWRTLRLLAQMPFYTPAKLIADNRAVIGVNIGHLWDETDLLQTWMQQIVNWYDEALFRPHIDRTFPLAEAAEAHHYVQDRRNLGKVLLVP